MRLCVARARPTRSRGGSRRARTVCGVTSIHRGRAGFDRRDEAPVTRGIGPPYLRARSSGRGFGRGTGKRALWVDDLATGAGDQFEAAPTSS